MVLKIRITDIPRQWSSPKKKKKIRISFTFRRGKNREGPERGFLAAGDVLSLDQDAGCMSMLTMKNHRVWCVHTSVCTERAIKIVQRLFTLERVESHL